MKKGSKLISLKNFVDTNIKINPNTNIIIKLVNTETNEKIFIGSTNHKVATYYTVIYDPQHTTAPIGSTYYCNRTQDMVEIINFLFNNEDIYATKQQQLNSADVLDQLDTLSLDDKRYEHLYRELTTDRDNNIDDDND